MTPEEAVSFLEQCIDSFQSALLSEDSASMLYHKGYCEGVMYLMQRQKLLTRDQIAILLEQLTPPGEPSESDENNEDLRQHVNLSDIDTPAIFRKIESYKLY